MPKKGFKHSGESRKKMSETQRRIILEGKVSRNPPHFSGELHHMWGKKHSEASKNKISKTKLSQNLRGEHSALWKTGDWMRECRRMAIAPNGKRMKFSRLIVETVLGRSLKEKEVVHHVNNNPKDDRKENLFVFRHQSAHKRWHHFLRRHNLDGTILKSNLELCTL